MAQFKGINTLQKFASAHALIHNHDYHLNPPRYLQTKPLDCDRRVASTSGVKPESPRCLEASSH